MRVSVVLCSYFAPRPCFLINWFIFVYLLFLRIVKEVDFFFLIYVTYTSNSDTSWSPQSAKDLHIDQLVSSKVIIVDKALTCQSPCCADTWKAEQQIEFILTWLEHRCISSHCKIIKHAIGKEKCDEKKSQIRRGVCWLSGEANYSVCFAPGIAAMAPIGPNITSYTIRWHKLLTWTMSRLHYCDGKY